jgi:hypothetical protein
VVETVPSGSRARKSSGEERLNLRPGDGTEEFVFGKEISIDVLGIEDGMLEASAEEICGGEEMVDMGLEKGIWEVPGACEPNDGDPPIVEEAPRCEPNADEGCETPLDVTSDPADSLERVPPVKEAPLGKSVEKTLLETVDEATTFDEE